jgi:ABC-2 type transport system permease protein
MLTDIRTVVWKEWIEWKRQYGNRKTAWTISIGMLILFGLILPMEFGKGWFDQEQALYAWVTLPLLLLLRSMGDTFAGERERHTLETVLSTRLPDAALYLGKMIIPAAYTWLFTQFVMLVALIPLYFLFPGNGPHGYSFAMLAAGWELSLLSSLYAAVAGVFLSLRAATVDAANQSMFLFLILFGALLGAVRGAFALLTSVTGMLAITPVLSMILLATILILIWQTANSFHRQRLLFEI